MIEVTISGARAVVILTSVKMFEESLNGTVILVFVNGDRERVQETYQTILQKVKKCLS